MKVPSISSSKRIMFYVQHLLGVGHVRRASLISSALVAAGFEVHVILGGVDVPGIPFPGAHVHRLAEARATDASFSSIVDATGSPVTKQWQARRRDTLLVLFHSIAPDILLIEQFPFGRRQFRFELIPLLETAHSIPHRPFVACSVRDFLVNKNNPDRTRETTETITNYFDQVLVHGDPSFLPFDASFDGTPHIATKLSYTGYVTASSTADPALGQSTVGTGEVIIATGGGAVGEQLLRTSIAARSLSRLGDHTWRILVGPNVEPHVRDDLEKMAAMETGVIVEPNRPDYLTLLSNCTVSISQAGYNTLMDIVTAQCPAVVVPFADGAENEQTIRARHLQEGRYVTLLDVDDLNAPVLAQTADSVYLQTPPDNPPFRTDGAAITAEILAGSSS